LCCKSKWEIRKGLQKIIKQIREIKVSKVITHPSDDVEIVAGAGPAKAKLAYLARGWFRPQIYIKKEKVTLCKQTAVP
jgi:hypothetical protein